MKIYYMAIHKDNQAYLMVITMIYIFCAVTITFTEKGNVIKQEKVNFIFGYVGALSLPIYLFHPIIITLIDYKDKDMKRWVKYIIVFPTTIILAFLYRIIADFLTKKMKEKKENKETKEISEKPEVIEKSEEDRNKVESKEKQRIEINGGSNENLV